MEQQTAIERAALIRQQRRAEITIGEGDDAMRFEVSVPTVIDMIDAGLDPILANVSASQEEKLEAVARQEQELTGDIRKFQPMAQKLLKCCMTKPRLHVDPEKPCPEDAVTPQDLGTVLFVLANAVMGIMTKEIGEVGSAAGRFRVDTDRTDDAGGVSDVRSESIGGDAAPAS